MPPATLPSTPRIGNTLLEGDWLGDEPAAPPNRGGRPAKGHKGRQRKLECPACGFIAYTTAGALTRAPERPQCCGEPLQLPNLRDRAAVEPDQLADDLARLPLADQNRAYRELGWTALTVPLDRNGRIASREHRGGSNRCAWEGGHCMVFTSTVYCDEHDPAAIARRGRESRRAA